MIKIPSIERLNNRFGFVKYIYNSNTEWIYRFDKRSNSYIPHSPAALSDAMRLHNMEHEQNLS
jgi:hypothetical protein